MSLSDDPTSHGVTCTRCGAPLTDGGCPRCEKPSAEDPTAPLSAAVAPSCSALPTAGLTDLPTADGESAQSPFTPTAHPRMERIDHYRIERELGAGGMGSVYLAFDEKMQRQVALKVLARHLAPSQSAGTRFDHEAWIAGKLAHPNLVKVYERGDWQDLSYISMELVRGGSLYDVLCEMKEHGRHENLGLAFGKREYVQWVISQMIAAARGLDYAHEKGVVHRDIKPMNLLLSKDHETVKIADFGLAIDSEMTRMTSVGTVLGTLVYMAPEQILGKTNEIDRRTDVYALGVTVFEMLTLEFPYAGATQQLYMNAVLTSEARRISKLNERVGGDLETVVRKALEKDPRDRYQTAAAFADDLQNVLDFRPIQATPQRWFQRFGKWVRRKPVHAALAALLIVAVPSLSVLGYRSFQHRKLVVQSEIDRLWREVDWLGNSSRNREVVQLVSSILDRDPRHTGALRTRANSFTELARRSLDPAEASDLGARAIADIDRLLALEPDVAAHHRFRAHVLDRLGRTEEAAAARTLAQQYRSDDPSDVELHLDAKLAFDQGEYAEAADLLTRLLKRSSNKPFAITLRARSLEALGRTDDALVDYRVAAALDEGSPEAYNDLGRLLTRDGRAADGEGYLLHALRLDPGNVHVLEALADNAMERGRSALGAGEADAARGQFEVAEGYARQALKQKADSAWAHLNLGAALMERNRLLPASDPELVAEGIGQYEEARRIQSSMGEGLSPRAYSSALVNLCDALIQGGELIRALEICSQVTRLTPDDAVAFYNLAGVYALLERDDEAFHALQRDFDLGDRDYRYLEGDRWFERLRNDPRFAELIARMKQASD